MTSLRIKGTFQWETNDQGVLRMGINHNGLPAYAGGSASNHVIKVEDETGTVVAMDNAGVTAGQIAVLQAYDTIYQRKRIAWIKLTFLPKWTEFPAGASDEGEPTGVPQYPIYIVSDMNGLETPWASYVASTLLANNSSIKMKQPHRRFKVFRTSHRFPYAPKYQVANQNAGSTGTDYSIAGAWRATDFVTETDDTHTALMMDSGAAIPPGVVIFDVVFEIKYVYADRQ